jgi:hypothetical protein
MQDTFPVGGDLMMKGAHWRRRPETGILSGAVKAIYER